MKPTTAGRILAALLAIPAWAVPNVVKIQNNYSYILPGMPNYGIAQGSIFDIFGNGLATATSPLQGVPLPTTITGTSVAITVGGVTTHAILYFVSAAQIAAILPSATPIGTGQLVVTLNGIAGPPATITVVQSAFGMLSLNAAGDGPAAVFDINSNYIGLTNAANPGDFITLWGSGVGPVTGDETLTQTPVNLTNIPLEVDIGGKPASIQYAGRSQYPGLDQINVVVPGGVSGCRTSVVVRSGDIVSNFGTMPIAASGRVCSDAVGGETAAQIEQLLSQPSITRGVLDFNAGPSTTSADAQFSRFTNAQYAAKQPGGFGISVNDCTVYNFTNINMATPNPIKPTLLDAGPSISLTPPSGSGIGNQSMPPDNGTYGIDMLNAPGSLKGTYTFSGTGGADIGPFSAQVTWPGGGGGFSYSTPGNPSSVNRSAGLTVTWSQPSNTDPSEFAVIAGYSFAPSNPWGAEFQCKAPLSPGRFAIPAAVLLALPSQAGVAMPFSELELDLVITKAFTAPGMDVGFINFDLADAETFLYL